MAAEPIPQSPPPSGHAAWIAPAVIVVAALVAFVATQHASLFAIPFINDDYLFLDKVRRTGFLALWAPHDLVGNYYRPWSRELHFWALDRISGGVELPFHVANVLLWLATLTQFFVL